MNAQAIMAPADLHNVLVCDPARGKLYWKQRDDCGPRWNGRYAGKEAFTCKEAHGYMTGRILRRFYKAHRVIWAMHYGDWPCGEIDHINGNRTDNRIENLRAVTRQENGRNTKIRTDNTSGHQGVTWHAGGKKWMATVAGKYLGLFSQIEDAVAARSVAAAALGFHENHGRVK